MDQDSQRARGLAPIWYGLLSLPGGIAGGFLSVTLAYLLRHNGVSVAAIAGLVGLGLLPQTWRFVMGPVVDMSLTGPRWYLICTAAMVAGLIALAFTPLNVKSVPVLSMLALTGGAASAAAASAMAAAMAATTPVSRRGAVAGWINAGVLGGPGLGGGAGLWLATHAGGPVVAALTLAALCAISAAPMLWVRTPPREEGAGLAALTALGSSLWRLLRTRQGVLAALVVTIPASLGAASSLFPAVAGDWHASADLVAAVTGVLGGVMTVPGCLIGGYLCDRFPRRIVYVSAALVIAGGEAAMALAPHGPIWFAGMVLGNALLLGIGYSALSAVIFECLGPKAAATVSSVLGSLANVPLVAMIAVVGAVQTRHGSTAMLLTEAGAGVVSALAYAALAYAWRPEAEAALEPGLAAA